MFKLCSKLLVPFFLFLCIADNALALDEDDIREILKETKEEEERAKTAKEKAAAEKAAKKAIEVAKRKENQKTSREATQVILKNANKAFQSKSYNTAYMYYNTIMASGNAAYANLSQVTEKIYAIELMAENEMHKAKVWEIKRRYANAAEVYMDVVDNFSYTPQASEARKLLGTLRERPSVMSALKFSEGKLEEDAGNYYEAQLIYKSIQKKWPESIAALRAKIATKKMNKDEFIRGYIKEREQESANAYAARLMQKSKSYLLNSVQGLKNKIKLARIQNFDALAIKELQKIKERFPNTKHAKNAADIIVIIKAGDRETAISLLTK